MSKLGSVLFVLVAACGGDPSADAGASFDAASADGGLSDAAAPGDGGAFTPSATFDLRCDEGPFPVDEVSPEPCGPESEPQCPTAPPAGAVPVAKVATCAYGRDETTCEPISGGNCGTTAGRFYDFNLINPNQGGPFGCWGSVHLLLEPRSDGTGFHVEWEALGLNDMDCSAAGEASGELDVESMCCEQIVDLHFPHGDFTFRVAIRIDWTPP